MQVGMNRSLGFKGNYNVELSTNRDAIDFSEKLDSANSREVHRKAGRGKYEVKMLDEYESSIGNNNPNKVIVRTDNPQFSKSDLEILKYGLNATKYVQQNQNLMENIFNKYATNIDLKV